MKAQRKQYAAVTATKVERKARLAEAHRESSARPSPALLLQQRLSAELGHSMGEPDRWSARSRMLFLIAAGCGSWALVIATALAVANLAR